MTSSDIIAIAKPWPIQYQVAHCIYDEFFDQGDRQEQNFGIKAEGMQNKLEIDKIPKFQIGFIGGFGFWGISSTDKCMPG